jgi:protein-L-isoaspartate(D-aspartate) O-methyltransferase
VHPDYRYLAYTDNAFPTKHGLTTSAPSVIAEFIRQSGAVRGDRVLEIGTGTGYEAALLSEMGAYVVSIEADRAVAREAERVLCLLGLTNSGRVELRTGNGRGGAPDRAPFHAVIVAAAARRTEDVAQLLRQLGDGGRLVAPMGPREGQVLHIFERRGGRISDSVLEGVSFSFVPLV